MEEEVKLFGPTTRAIAQIPMLVQDHLEMYQDRIDTETNKEIIEAISEVLKPILKKNIHK